jgi:hypothetical protein
MLRVQVGMVPIKVRVKIANYATSELQSRNDSNGLLPCQNLILLSSLTKNLVILVVPKSHPKYSNKFTCMPHSVKQNFAM